MTEAGRYYLEHGRYPVGQAGATLRPPRRNGVHSERKAAEWPDVEPEAAVEPAVGVPLGPPDPTPAE